MWDKERAKILRAKLKLIPSNFPVYIEDLEEMWKEDNGKQEIQV